MQLFERVAQRFVLVRFHRVEAGEHLRFDLLEPRQRPSGRLVGVGDGVAHLRGAQLLDIRSHEADFAGGKGFFLF